MHGENYVEPWLRETHYDLPVVERAVLHALEMAEEDLTAATALLTEEQWFERPGGINSVSFHALHLAGSMDRLLTYAECHALSSAQREFARSENADSMPPAETLDLFHASIARTRTRLHALCARSLDAPAYVGGKRIPTTVGALLIHLAEHTARHVGQVITTVQIVRALSR